MQIIPNKITLVSFFSLLNLLILQPNTHAHAIKIIPEINQAISLQAKYESGLPMQQAQVIVYAPNQPNKPWMQGMTNNEGKFIFIPDNKLSGNWQIKVSQAGHGNIINIPYFPSNIVAEKSTVISNNSNNNLTNNLTNNQLINNTPTNNSQILSENYQIQKSLMIASIVWGCVGTALFFVRTKSPNFSDSKLSKERNY
ncbi:MAG: carboxypeptidase regulatory-like domain-containing protein [Microcoleaceae cyanobacterium]